MDESEERENTSEELDGTVDFLHPDFRCAVQYLSMKIRCLDYISINDTDSSYARTGNICRCGTS